MSKGNWRFALTQRWCVRVWLQLAAAATWRPSAFLLCVQRGMWVLGVCVGAWVGGMWVRVSSACYSCLSCLGCICVREVGGDSTANNRGDGNGLAVFFEQARFGAPKVVQQPTNSAASCSTMQCMLSIPPAVLCAKHTPNALIPLSMPRYYCAAIIC